MLLDPLPPAPLGDPLLAELTALYASNHAFHTLSGDFPDPHDIRPEQVAAALSEERERSGTDILLARSSGRLTGIAVTLAHHPDPADPDPWIGLLMVDARLHGQGHGRRLAALVEERFRAAGRTAARLAVLANNPRAMAFWTALGYEVLDHRADRGMGRPCTVLRKALSTP
ncbi:GNAT family N-acetyltransferase [Streptomyces paradoxus]|uniref:GNAT family N-acetyltransferase n=1 Tax=Streptomyces paradoxus TaxID=66375 RepID=UPI003815B074